VDKLTFLCQHFATSRVEELKRKWMSKERVGETDDNCKFDVICQEYPPSGSGGYASVIGRAEST
jgi:hypothetical protein